MLLLCTLPAAAATLPPRSLADMSFEELADIEITSVSKKAERLGAAAASIYVITADDIRRYGANTLPETLRLAPNLHVARLNAQQYAISARGFNNATGNKLLVLIDGRIVYTPLYSGVFWDAHDVPLEDVERIEVISGPGGTLWGTNAVNGVINIITRAARDTQGAHLAAGGGNQETGAGLRYGGRLTKEAHYRVYGKVIERANGQPVRDAWRRAQSGFRVDWGQAQDRFTVQGDSYTGDLDQPGAIAAIRGVNLLTPWRHALDKGARLNLLAYFDRTERDFPGVYRESTDIANVEFQHSLAPLAAYSLIWGASFRQGHDHEENGTALAFLPAHFDQEWSSLFAQDEIAWHDDWRLILGARLIELPVTAPLLPMAALAPGATAAIAPLPEAAGVHTLLYVEDNPANLRLVEHLIAFRADLRLLTATEAEFGLALARAHQPDVVLMDINLPGMSGNEAMLVLRGDPRTEHIPVLALSANAMPRAVAESMACGFFHYLIKPIVIDEFFDALDSALASAASRRRNEEDKMEACGSECKK